MTALCTVDVLVLDDFALEPMGREESRDIDQLFVERNGRFSTVVTSNRDTSEWLATFDAALLAQSAVDCCCSSATRRTCARTRTWAGAGRRGASGCM